MNKIKHFTKDIMWIVQIKSEPRKAMADVDSVLKSRDIILLTKFHIVKAMLFQESCIAVGVGPLRRMSTKELMLLNCGARENSWEPRGQQGDRISQS